MPWRFLKRRERVELGRMRAKSVFVNDRLVGEAETWASVYKLLAEKGLVLRTETAKAHSYFAAVSQEDTQNQLLRDLSDRLFFGSAARLAMHALSLDPAHADDLEAVRQLLKERKAK